MIHLRVCILYGSGLRKFIKAFGNVLFPNIFSDLIEFFDENMACFSTSDIDRCIKGKKHCASK